MKTKLLLTISLFLIGCHASDPEPTTVPPTVESTPVEIMPLQPERRDLPPPSSTFLRGYWDGYTGTWLGPASWTLSSRYRQGYAIGKKDREEGNEPRYEHRW